MTLAVWNCHSRKVSPPPRVRETKRSPRQILLKQYLPGVQTPAKLPLSGDTHLSSFVFSPFIPVPGLDRGSPWALFVCFVPRILVGVSPWLVYALFRHLPGGRRAGVQTGAMALAGVVGAITNTALVMGLIGVVFTDAYAAARGIPVETVAGFILGIVAANGIPEAVVAAVVTPAVCVPLVKALKLEKTPAAAGQPA